MFLQVGETETRLECLLNNNKNSDFCAPLTSFDWNEVDPYLLGEGFEFQPEETEDQKFEVTLIYLGCSRPA